ncbi:uncharacterized protein BXZ73DRAFT_102546 [Epithele typhae]|uniref:uncharacterized protein n=1 Tax=Epithele typhae TaxID=378194 RepID=UPI002008EB4A|nr:uncharacterized protein BXZ73DRAFT_102546 [Epithele typhae]KAH9928039.1 hypothetical protein BXZ73DRAFT_102546 [Epithele typhae]
MEDPDSGSQNGSARAKHTSTQVYASEATPSSNARGLSQQNGGAPKRSRKHRLSDDEGDLIVSGNQDDSDDDKRSKPDAKRSRLSQVHREDARNSEDMRNKTAMKPSRPSKSTATQSPNTPRSTSTSGGKANPGKTAARKKDAAPKPKTLPATPLHHYIEVIQPPSTPIHPSLSSDWRSRPAPASTRKVDEQPKILDDAPEAGSREKKSTASRSETPVTSDASSETETDGSDTEPKIGIELKIVNQRLNLGDQTARVSKILKLSTPEALKHALFVHAFPDGPKKDDAMRPMLLAITERERDPQLARRITRDDDYSQKLAKHPLHRITLLRGRVKATVANVMCGAFGVRIIDATKAAWLQHNERYIYIKDLATENVDTGRPFGHPIYSQVLNACFFDKARSYGERFASEFKSSLPSHPHQKEIPAPMLALVATAIFAVLQETKNPDKRRKGQDFASNLFTSKYEDIIDLLCTIQPDDKRYHSLMHGLWKRSVSSDAVDPTTDKTSEFTTKKLLDLSAMSTDF